MKHSKIKYISEEENLQKKNFIPDNEDWIDYTNIPHYSAIKLTDYVVLTMPFLTFTGGIHFSKNFFRANLATCDLSA